MGAIGDMWRLNHGVFGAPQMSVPTLKGNRSPLQRNTCAHRQGAAQCATDTVPFLFRRNEGCNGLRPHPFGRPVRPCSGREGYPSPSNRQLVIAREVGRFRALIIDDPLLSLESCNRKRGHMEKAAKPLNWVVLPGNIQEHYLKPSFQLHTKVKSDGLAGENVILVFYLNHQRTTTAEYKPIHFSKMMFFSYKGGVDVDV